MENSTTNTAGFNSVSYSVKPSKSAIIQRLLDEKLITVEEAMTLMEYHHLQHVQPYPYMPSTPYPTNPFQPYCNSVNDI